MKEKIKVLVVEPWKRPYAMEIPAGLESLQKMVGGLIQAVYPFEDAVALICNDEGKRLGLTEDDFSSLTDKIIERIHQLIDLPNHHFSRLQDLDSMCCT